MSPYTTRSATNFSECEPHPTSSRPVRSGIVFLLARVEVVKRSASRMGMKIDPAGIARANVKILSKILGCLRNALAVAQGMSRQICPVSGLLEKGTSSFHDGITFDSSRSINR